MSYGWIPDVPDQRDYPYTQLAAAPPILPSSVDLRSHCSPIENQGELGSCTSCALVGNLEFLKNFEEQKINFSKLFLYYNERAIRKAVESDSGASLRDGIKSLVKEGCCKETLWPYHQEDFAKKPDSKAYEDALRYQITKYFRLQTIQEMKHTLSQGFPFVFGFAVYESFESEEVKKTGKVPLPLKTERFCGGHAVMAVGYKDETQQLIVRNSWGCVWGDHGYFYLPYEYYTNLHLASDFWTVRDME